MRLLLLVLISAALPLAAQHLTNEQILSQLDDAAASEARWILNSWGFTEGGYGIACETTRATAAFKRLVAGKSTKAFELLAQSEHAPAVIHGLHGLSKLKAATKERLLRILPAAIMHTAYVDTTEGCISNSEIPASMILELLEGYDLKDEEILKVVFLKLLGRVIIDPWQGYWGGWFKEKLGAWPECPSPKLEQAREFTEILSIEDNDERHKRVRELCSVTDKPILRQLCLEFSMVDEVALIDGVWSRELTDSMILDVLILSIKCEKAPKLATKRFIDDDLFEDMSPFTCFHQLTAGDWEWLLKHDSKQVAGAARILQSNIVSGWRIDAKPGNKTDSQLWFQFCLHYAAGGNKRARHAVIRELTTSGQSGLNSWVKRLQLDSSVFAFKSPVHRFAVLIS